MISYKEKTMKALNTTVTANKGGQTMKALNTTVKTTVTAKGEQIMNNQSSTTNKKEFNLFSFVVNKMVKEYVKDETRKTFEIELKHLDDAKYTFSNGETVEIKGARNILKWLERNEAFTIGDIVETTTQPNEYGETKRVYKVQLKDFNIKAKGTSRENKKYPIFANAYGWLKLQ